jgi:hypothetical protein
MSLDTSKLPLPKGRTRRQLKSTQDRAEAKVKKAVRAACVARDAYCRFNWFSPWFDRRTSVEDVKPIHHCGAPSEWCHFGEKKRAKTRGMAAEQRHTTAGSLMLCAEAHRAYDAGQLKITALTRKGCDGRLKFRWAK